MPAPLFGIVTFLQLCWFFCMFLRLINAFLPLRSSDRRINLALIAFFAVVQQATLLIPLAPLMTATRCAVYLGFILLTSRGRFAQRLIILALYVIILIISEILATATITLLQISVLADLIIINLFTGIYCWMGLQLTKGIQRALGNQISRRVWIEIGYCVLATLLFTTQFWFLYYNLAHGEASDIFHVNLRDLLSVLLMLMQLGVVYVLFSIVHEMSANLEALGSARITEMEARHDLDEQRLTLETMERMRIFRQDMRAHLAKIEALAGDGARQGAYIRALTRELSPAGAQRQLCGNRLIDSLISLKFDAMKKQGIRCSMTLSSIPDDLGLDDVGLCAVLGNALDNAIEACERLDDARKEIALSVRMEESDLCLKIENPCAYARATAARILKGRRNRLAKVGAGFENMRAAVRAAGGGLTLDGSEADDRITLRVLLPAALSKEVCL